MKFFGNLLVAISILVVASCGNADNNATETAFSPSSSVKASDNSKPLTVNIALNDTYAKKTACVCIHDVAAREYEEVVKMLKEKYNINFNITYFVEPFELEKALKKKKFDGVICKPWRAIMLTKQYKLNYKRVADILNPENSPWLYGVYFVKKDSPIKSMEEITGKVLVAGQPDSYEKYHMPYRQLKKKGIKPSKIINKSSCLESIGCLVDDKAEIAMVSDYTMYASCAVDIARAEDFKIIGRTKNMPLCSVILDMDRISESDALRLQNALLGASGANSPESMLSKGFVKPSSWKPVEFKGELIK